MTELERLQWGLVRDMKEAIANIEHMSREERDELALVAAALIYACKGEQHADAA